MSQVAVFRMSKTKFYSLHTTYVNMTAKYVKCKHVFQHTSVFRAEPKLYEINVQPLINMQKHGAKGDYCKQLKIPDIVVKTHVAHVTRLFFQYGETKGSLKKTTIENI